MELRSALSSVIGSFDLFARFRIMTSIDVSYDFKVPVIIQKETNEEILALIIFFV